MKHLLKHLRFWRCRHPLATFVKRLYGYEALDRGAREEWYCPDCEKSIYRSPLDKYDPLLRDEDY